MVCLVLGVSLSGSQPVLQIGALSMRPYIVEGTFIAAAVLALGISSFIEGSKRTGFVGIAVAVAIAMITFFK